MMKFRVPLLWLLVPLLTLATVGASAPRAQAPAGRSAPKLVVLLVVDQMRADYLETYGGHFEGGLHRLTTQGAWFQRAAYPYLNTVTCAGHATIGSGSFPYRHGLVLNEWYDRESGQTVPCTGDPGTKDVSYSGLEVGTDGPKHLRVPSFAEQLRDRTRGRVVTLSMKARAAIMMAGHKADAVLWFDPNGGWESSSAYGDKPVSVLKEYTDAHPVSALADKVWERMRPPSDYRYDDDAVGERPPGGWTRTFPHPLAIPAGKVDSSFYARWESSPYGDDYLGAMAAAAVQEMQLGHGKGIDFLGVSFSSLDLVGHAYGPRSHEVQDLLLRLDVTIGKLLDALDQHVGPGNYVVALTADHGVATIPEQIPGGGRQTSQQVIDVIDRALKPVLGTGKFVSATAYTDVYLSRGVYDRLKRDGRLMKATLDSLGALPGIARVLKRDELESSAARSSSDPQIRAAALNFDADRSGDLIIIPRENWILSTAATTHGTLWPYDENVPVILFGSSITAGHYSQAASPADIAPTFAALTGTRIAKTDGRVLTEAITTTVDSER